MKKNKDIMDFMSFLCALCPLPTVSVLNGQTRVLCQADEDVRGTGVHKHKCDDCGTVWKHGDELLLASHEQFVEGHTCPKCGSEQRMKFGDWL
jgi:hypothetical protein